MSHIYPDNLGAAAEIYESNYDVIEQLYLDSSAKIFLGDSKRPRHCRFCGQHEPSVSFRHEAHAVPAAFGRIELLSHYECDLCNHHFGDGIENHLGNWTKPTRTLCRIMGRKGVPTIKSNGDKGWRIAYTEDSGFQMSNYESEPHFIMDEAKKKVRFELHRDPYVPVAVLKGLVKIGLTLIPDEEVHHFRETYDWIRETNHSRNFTRLFPTFKTWIPGPRPNKEINLIVMRRRRDVESVPYAFCALVYGNEALQFFLPSVTQDQCIRSEVELPPFPTPESEDPARYGLPFVTAENLTGHQLIKGDKISAALNFDSAVFRDFSNI